MALPDPQQAAQDWANRSAASTDKMSRGVDAVTVAPGQLAARQADAYANNVMANKAKFARRVAAVSLTDWQTAFKNKALPRIATGVQEAIPKMAAFNAAFYPVLAAAVKSLPPRGTYEQNKARAIAMMDAAHKFSYTTQ